MCLARSKAKLVSLIILLSGVLLIFESSRCLLQLSLELIRTASGLKSPSKAFFIGDSGEMPVQLNNFLSSLDISEISSVASKHLKCRRGGVLSLYVCAYWLYNSQVEHWMLIWE